VSRELTRYTITAKKLGISLDEYLAKGESGRRYCSRCLKWKSRSSFLEYEHTKTYYSGICKVCTKVKSTPKGVDKARWGPSIAAANRIGIPIKEYMAQKDLGFNWCVDHKGWFEPKNVTTAVRCDPCNRKRQEEYRAKKKRMN